MVKADLDQPGVLLVSTDPVFSTTLLMFFQHIRGVYALPPYPQVPQSFTKWEYANSVKTLPGLAEVQPLALKLAIENPDRRVVLVSTKPSRDKGYSFQDSRFHTVPVYESPRADDLGYAEFFQVLLLQKQ